MTMKIDEHHPFVRGLYSGTHAERRAMWMEARRRSLLEQISRSNVEGGAGVWLCNDRADNEVIYRINRELVDAAREDDNAAS